MRTRTLIIPLLLVTSSAMLSLACGESPSEGPHDATTHDDTGVSDGSTSGDASDTGVSDESTSGDASDTGVSDDYELAVHITCDDGALGEHALGPGAFTDGASRTVYSDAASYNGTQVCETTNAVNDENTFKFGGWVAVPPQHRVGEGGEVWYSVRIQWADAGYSDASPWLKFLRMRIETPDQVPLGHNDIYIEQGGALRYIREGLDTWRLADPEVTVQVGEWETYEFYTRFGTLSADDDPTGGGLVRLWKDGVLILEATDLPTWTSSDIDSGATFWGGLLFTYWNGEPNLPTAEHQVFIEDLRIATSFDPPTATDADGNRFIGVD